MTPGERHGTTAQEDRAANADPATVQTPQPTVEAEGTAAASITDHDGISATDPAPVHADLWQRIRAGFALPPLATPLVEEKERFYLRHPEALQRMFARGGRYLFHIVEQVEERGLPTELALLPFVESAMNPEALSIADFFPSSSRSTGPMVRASRMHCCSAAPTIRCRGTGGSTCRRPTA